MTTYKVCGKCKNCAVGNTNVCIERLGIGSKKNGCFAEYVEVPATSCIKMQDNMSFEEGALIEVLACGVHAVRETTTTHADEVVVVSGPGPVSYTHLCCTGKPAFFLSAYNCENGDIGAIQPNDLIIAISNSGETTILKELVIPSAKTIGAKAICLTGNTESTLAKLCDVALYIGVEKEACPTGVNATTSTTNTLATVSYTHLDVYKRQI